MSKLYTGKKKPTKRNTEKKCGITGSRSRLCGPGNCNSD